MEHSEYAMPLILAESYLHTLDPFAIQFTPTFGIRWYGLAYAFAFLLGWLLIRWVARKRWSPMPAEKVGDFLFAGILGVLLGGRLGYALFYEQHLFITFTRNFPYWDLLAINKGGMSSHGGMIGVILATVWFTRRHRVSALHLLDLAALTAAIGIGVGRIANFINAELWGRPLPDHLQSYVPGKGLTGLPGGPPWWSVKYPQEVIERWTEIVNNHRMVIDERATILKNQLQSTIGSTGDFYARVVERAQDSDPQVVQTLTPLLTAYYPSQIYQAIIDGAIVFAIMLLIWLRPRKPGVIGSWFFILYGMARIITEFYRQPDAGVPLTFGLFSRGQTLSALMIAAGVAVLIFVSRRNVPRIGGLFSDGQPLNPDP